MVPRNHPAKKPLDAEIVLCEGLCEERFRPRGILEPFSAVGATAVPTQDWQAFQPHSLMKFAPHIELIGSVGVVTRIHAEFARRLIFSGKGVPVRNGKRIVAVQLPSVPCGERDNWRGVGAASLRMHKTEAHEGGQVLTIEIPTTIRGGQVRYDERTVTTQPCRTYALKHSSKVLDEVLTAERREWMAVTA